MHIWAWILIGFACVFIICCCAIGAAFAKRKRRRRQRCCHPHQHAQPAGAYSNNVFHPPPAPGEIVPGRGIATYPQYGTAAHPPVVPSAPVYASPAPSAPYNAYENAPPSYNEALAAPVTQPKY